MRASIIVAAHQEGDRLWRTIGSCLESAVGLDHEIVIADDASIDGSVEEVEHRFPLVRVFRHEKRRGAAPTKALGAKHARGDVLIFLDGHCKPEHGALARLVEDVEGLSGQAIVTPTIAALKCANWTNDLAQVGHGYFLNLADFSCGWIGVGRLDRVDEGRRQFYESPALIGCVLAVSRELYHRLRGFDAQMRFWGVEDLDFGLKCWLMGSRILHDPEAVVGHRFRGSFDNFSVPLEHIVVNQLRMARKHFTLAAWTDWVSRCRQHHQGSVPDHPEGLWALAWNLFEAERVSVEHERSYLLGNRQRDEFWYAERFGLDWPQFGTMAASTEPRGLFGQPSPSPSPSPPPRRLVLLTGYWPPTDIGVAGDRTFPQPPFPEKTVSGHGMLWKWRNLQQNYMGSGYDVLAITPTFKAVQGYNNATFMGQPVVVPYWGKGTGTLMVDYRKTSTDFWRIVQELRPIAIMSFSRGRPNETWVLEPFGTNWARDQAVPQLLPNQFWTLELNYLNFQNVQTTEHWDKPYIGGSADDPSPFRNQGAIKYDPPDRTLPALSQRDSNLPMAAIVEAINAHFGGMDVIASIGAGGAGNFVSDFMAYHVAWYREWWTATNTDPSKTCLFSGHTHVGIFVEAADPDNDGETAVDIQLAELFKVLPKP